MLALVIAATALYGLAMAAKGDSRTSASRSGSGKEAAAQPASTQTSQPPPDVSAGLQALLDTIVASKGDYAIAVVDPRGPHASANGNKIYTAASTYKLFIAYGVFRQIDSGAMHWADTILPGRSAEQCFRLMIVNSDNDCAEAFGNKIGWQTIDDMIDRLGLHNTQVKFHDNSTTANDLALYLSKLQGGTLLTQTDSQILLGDMRQQIYREGIPAGTGVAVADKVGFLDAYLHDAGIVYGPKGEYVLVIMSNNSSWSQLADAAKQVHTFLSK